VDKCPGGELRHLTAEDVKCQSCGAAVEMFSDEQKRTCPACGHRVTRETAPACAAWCDAAKECLGADRFAEFVEQGLLEEEGESGEPPQS
jgi:predicted RNA-binding Zn-ribbon protein involved in translation (DUF1610 family)